jgi:hypothetical protein
MRHRDSYPDRKGAARELAKLVDLDRRDSAGESWRSLTGAPARSLTYAFNLSLATMRTICRRTSVCRVVRGVMNGASDVKTASLAADRYEVFFSAGVATLARMLVALQSLFSSTRMRRRAHLLLAGSALVLSSVALQADPNKGERNFQIAVAAGFNRISQQ